jgi:hypothetical protein
MFPARIARRISRLVFMAILLVALLLLATQVAGAEELARPTRATAVSLKNPSNYFLTFFIDGENMVERKLLVG